MAFGSLRGTLQVAATSITNPISAAGSVVVAVDDLIFAVCAEQSSLTATGTPTDNLGNVYSYCNPGTDAGTSTGRAAWARVTNPGTLTAVRFPATASNDNVVVLAEVLEGPFSASPLGANPANAALDTSSPYLCPATGVRAQTEQVILCWIVQNGNVTLTATSPNTKSHQLNTASILTAAMGYQVVTSTASVQPAWTSSATPTDNCMGTASFKRRRVFEIGLAIEADSTFAVAAPVPNLEITPESVVTEIPVVGAATAHAVVPVGLASEADSTFAVSAVTGAANHAVAPVSIAIAAPIVGTAVVHRVINIGIPAEVEVALPVGRAKTKAIGVATETGSPFTVTRRRTYTIGLASEDSNVPIPTRQKAKITGLAEETDSSLAPTRRKTVTTGLAAETDSSLVLLHAITKAIGLATEADSALHPSRAKSIGVAVEADAAVDVIAIPNYGLTPASIESVAPIIGTATAHVVVPLGIAIDTDSTFALTATKIVTTGLASEADNALNLVVAPSTNRAIVPESIVAEAPVVGSAIAHAIAAIGVASEGDSALPIGFTVGANHEIVPLGAIFAGGVFMPDVFVDGVFEATGTWYPAEIATGVPSTSIGTIGVTSAAVGTGLATETDTVFGVGKAKTKTIGLATETDTTSPMGKAKAIGTAIEADTTFSLGKAKTKLLSLATEVNSPLTPGKAKAKAIGLTNEADNATTFTDTQSRMINTGFETDIAFGVYKTKVKAIGIAIDVSTAVSVSHIRSKTIGIATETDSARSMGRRKFRTIGLATESDRSNLLTSILTLPPPIKKTVTLILTRGVPIQDPEDNFESLVRVNRQLKEAVEYLQKQVATLANRK